MFLRKLKSAAAVLSLTAIAAFTLSGCSSNNDSSAQADKMVLRYAENHDENYPTTKAAYKFAELVKEKTNGRIEIEVYHSAKLGDEKSVIEQVQQGDIDFARTSLSPLAEYDRELNVLQLPYLYRDKEHMWKVLDGEIGQNLLNGMADKANVVGLSWFDSGARNFYDSKLILNEIEDFQNLRIRVQESSLMVDAVKALGADPVPMPYGDVTAALEKGDIDGAENNWPSYESSGHYKNARYYVVDEHTRVPEVQMISKKLWDSLSESDQQIIRECAAESAAYEKAEWAKSEQEAEAKMRSSDVTITELTPQERQKFQDAMSSVYEEYGRNMQDLITQIKNIQ